MPTQHAIRRSWTAVAVCEAGIEAGDAVCAAPVVRRRMLDLALAREESKRELEHPRCAQQPSAFAVRKCTPELDDPACLREPDLATEGTVDLAGAPGLQAVDVRVVVKPPGRWHHRLQAAYLVLELCDVAQRGARIVLIEHVQPYEHARRTYAPQCLVIAGGGLR